MHAVRLAVRENALSDESRVRLEHYRAMLQEFGRGWVHEESDKVVAFGIADHAHRNIWALFVAPGFEGQGIGSELLDVMVKWLFEQSRELVWLTTERTPEQNASITPPVGEPWAREVTATYASNSLLETPSEQLPATNADVVRFGQNVRQGRAQSPPCDGTNPTRTKASVGSNRSSSDTVLMALTSCASTSAALSPRRWSARSHHRHAGLCHRLYGRRSGLW